MADALRVLSLPRDAEAVERLVESMRLDPLAMTGDEAAAAVVRDVAARGDAALVELARRYDDPEFTVADLRVSREALAAAADRTDPGVLVALRRAIAQVREYQSHIRPVEPPTLHRAGVELGLRFTPVDSAGLYVPGGKASYPSSLVMLAVPAQVAGVGRIVVCTPPGKNASDALMAAAHLLGIDEVYRVGGPAAIAAMALGTATIARVDKIAGPGNALVQAAKRRVAGAVGVDAYAGPSEILVLADASADARAVAADLLAQAEHDPGSCFLLTDSLSLVDAVNREIAAALPALSRREAIARALAGSCAAVVGDWPALLDLANRLAAEHVSIAVSGEREAAVLAALRHGGCVFVGRYSPVAAGDYVAGPSHCLPTSTTARFASGVSVYEFLKRSGVVRYSAAGLAADAPAIAALAAAEGLDAHARSVAVR